MRFSEIQPSIRFVQHLNVNPERHFPMCVGLDARFFYTMQGYGKIKAGSTEYEMREHSLLIINSGVPYHILSDVSEARYLQINFDFTKNALIHSPVLPVPVEKFEVAMLLDPVTFEDSDALSRVFFLEEIDSIQGKLRTIVSEYTRMLLYYKERMGHLLGDILTECVRHAELPPCAHDKVTQNNLLLFLHENFKRNLTNREIGEQFGYHPNYVNSLIKQLTGLSLHAYLLRLRLEYAVSLLTSTTLSIAEISALSGFCDCAYFSKYFKKHFGVSPSHYRQI